MASKKLIKKLDKVFSQYIRSHGQCEWCGRKDGQLQCCHIFSRKFHNTRWHEMNVLCMCAGCHHKAHAEPIAFVEFVKDYLGEGVYEELKLEHNRIRKWKDYDLEELIEKYENPKV
jgi:hypothetical protein